MTTKTIKYKAITLNSILDLLALLGLAIYIPSSVLYASSSIADISQLLFLGVVLAKIIFSGKIRFNYFFWASLIYTIILGISYLYAPDKTIGYQHVYRSIIGLIFTFFVINYIDNKRKIMLILKIYAFVGMIAFIYVIYIYGTDVFSLASHNALRLGSEMGGENSNIVNIMGLASGYGIIISTFLLTKDNIVKYRILYIVNCLAGLSIAMLTASKKAFILILIGTPIVIYLSTGRATFSKKLKYFFLSIITLIFIYIVVTSIDSFWYMEERINEMFIVLMGKGTSGASGTSDIYRLNLIKQGIKSFLEAPILGNGAGYSIYLFGTYSHNNYIELLMNTGLLGFITYYSSYIISIIRLKRKNTDVLELNSLFLLIIISLMILEIALVDYYLRYFQILLATISVYVNMNAMRIRSKTQDR